MTKPTLKMLFIGEPLREYSATLENGNLENQTSTGKFGGDIAPNTASYAKMAAEQYEMNCEMNVLSAVGTDEVSDQAIADLQARGLGTGQVKRIEGKTLGNVINITNYDGVNVTEKVRMDRANSAFRNLLDDATDEDLKKMVEGYTHVVISGVTLGAIRAREKLIKLLDYAKANGTKIVVSTNLRPSNWQMPDDEHPDGIGEKDDAWKEKANRWLDQAVAKADVIFANQTDEAERRNSDDVAAIMEPLYALNPNAEILLTNDKDPILLSYFDGQRVVNKYVETHPPKEVLDTVGAGDSFAGTYLMAREAKFTPERATKLGSFVASQVIGIRGALPPVGESPEFTMPGTGQARFKTLGG